MNIERPYAKRRVRRLSLIKHGDWNLEIYSISIKNSLVSEELVEAVKVQLPQWLRHIDAFSPNYKIGALIIHEGQDGIYILLNWWTDENLMRNQVYFSTYQEPERFIDLSERRVMACVWELAILWHERNSWVANVLKKNTNPDTSTYLHDFLNKEIL